MSAQDRLTAAATAIHERRYADALEGLLWFHEHALEETPELSGVRLSFALGWWSDLAALYAPALTALHGARDKAAAALLRADGTRALFHEVRAIDEHLHQVDQTYRLLLALEEGNPELAVDCGRLALDALIAAGDFPRASRIMPEPEALIRRAGAALERRLLRGLTQKYTGAPTRWAEIRNHIEDVQQLLAIVRGIEEPARAAALAQLAVTQLSSPSVRRDVAAGLVKPLPAPMPDKKRFRLDAMRARQRATAARRRARMQRGLVLVGAVPAVHQPVQQRQHQ